MDAYRSSTAYSSPGLGPIHATAYSIEERSSEHKADPYRSAYSQSVNHNHNHLGASNNSQYQDSGNGSPNPNEDFSSSFESRFSGISQQQQQQHAGQIRYPARDLAGQDSKQALSASFFEMGGLHSKREATSSSEAGVVSSSNKDKPATVVGSFSPKTRQSIAHPSQPSKTDSLETTLQAKTMEEEENDVILQKLGVLSAVSSESRSGGTRSGITYGSGRSRRKGQWTDESEEESHDRGGNGSSGQSRRVRRRGPDGQMMMGGGRRRREAQRRTPVFVFQSVSSMGPPVVTKDRIREPFSIQLLVDSKSNYVPIRLSALEMIAWLTLDQTKVADNDKLLSSFVIEPRVEQIISIPMMLDYRSARQGMDLNSDPVLQELVEACTFVSPESNLEVPTIRLTIGGKLYIWGLSWIWKPVFTFNANHVPCPVNSRDPILPGTPSPPATLRPIPVPTVTAIMANDSWTASMTMTTPMAAAEAAAASHVVATTSGRWPR
ncbi:hypothetical protein EDD11_004018 [Mortierella claussenii]|nr:hypothetical protein EDD11_004018 [Mortierella claussenii]